MEYNEIIQYLSEVPKFGKKNKLENIKVLMNKLNNPQDKLKIIHVTGTNGKGSVCSYINSILTEQGYNVGLFTSPHLIKFNERIRYNSENIPDKEFQHTFNIVMDKIKEMLLEGDDHPTFFEIFTAMSFVYFDNKKTDFVILEVGIGGKYDSTNIIKNPLVSVITNISKDHTKVLGDTIEEIAKEKSGIIKKNCPVVLYFNDKKVYNIVNKISKNQKSMLFSLNNIKIKNHCRNISNQQYTILTEYFQFDDIKTSLIGDYQAINSAIAILSVYVLRKLGIIITENSIYKGIKNAKWDGRFEYINGKVPMIIDGAHNVGAVKTFNKELRGYFPNKSINIMLSICSDKDYKKMIEIIMENKNIKNIILTKINSARATKLQELEGIIKHYNIKVYCTNNVNEALKLGEKLTTKDELLCCIGSLYLVGEIKYIMSKMEDKYD